MSGTAAATAAAIALPVGIGLGHVGRGGVLAANLSNFGRAIPSFGLLVILFQVYGITVWPTFIVLVLLAIPPILTNSYAGIRGVDPDMVDAARGMGMRGGQTLLRVELPVAMPLVMAGVRTATVQVVATAALGAVVAWGGLGRYVVDGIAAQDNVKVFSGALLVAFLSVGTEVGLAAVHAWSHPSRCASDGFRPRMRPSPVWRRRWIPPRRHPEREDIDPCGSTVPELPGRRSWHWPSWPAPAARRVVAQRPRPATPLRRRRRSRPSRSDRRSSPSRSS